MYLTHIGISELRSIKLLSLKPSETLNFIMGPNNAGKTTILESMYLVSTSKSFKSSDLDKLANYHSKGYKISLKFCENTSNDTIIYEKLLNKPKRLYHNDKLSSVSQVMRCLPIQILNFGNQNIFNQKSDARRYLIDWGVFHVEPSYSELLKAFSTILQSRNKILKRRDVKELDVWTERFVDVSEKINSMRESYFAQLSPEFIDLLSNTNGLNEYLYDDISTAKLIYSKGWKDSLMDELKLCLDKDLALGYTSKGPHRADFNTVSASGHIKEVGSMSTQVILNFCICLAQARVFHVEHKHKPVMLIDDLFFGIDNKNLEVVIKLLNDSGQQCFLTAPDSLEERLLALKTKPKGKFFDLDNGEIIDKQNDRGCL